MWVFDWREVGECVILVHGLKGIGIGFYLLVELVFWVTHLEGLNGIDGREFVLAKCICGILVYYVNMKLFNGDVVLYLELGRSLRWSGRILSRMNIKTVLKSSWNFTSGFWFQILFWNFEWIFIAWRVWRHLDQHVLRPRCSLFKLYPSNPWWAVRASARPPALALLALLERHRQSSFLIHELHKQLLFLLHGQLLRFKVPRQAHLRYRRNVSCRGRLTLLLLRWPPTFDRR